MRVKIVCASGYEVEGVVNKLPKPESKAFYLHHDGNGTMELIYVEPGMRIIRLGGKT